jgi:hypothetical protein
MYLLIHGVGTPVVCLKMLYVAMPALFPFAHHIIYPQGNHLLPSFQQFLSQSHIIETFCDKLRRRLPTSCIFDLSGLSHLTPLTHTIRSGRFYMIHFPHCS